MCFTPNRKQTNEIVLILNWKPLQSYVCCKTDKVSRHTANSVCMPKISSNKTQIGIESTVFCSDKYMKEFADKYTK